MREAAAAPSRGRFPAVRDVEKESSEHSCTAVTETSPSSGKLPLLYCNVVMHDSREQGPISGM